MRGRLKELSLNAGPPFPQLEHPWSSPMCSRLCTIACHFSVLQTRRQPRFNGEVKHSAVEELSWRVPGR